ncbi:helix-turn-helix transcriptional regulator [Halorientalis halophila]|uniref:helix-turn-helix transcriptional regulator n=1 Tax=Halorientalis halophila TaxID=3108499 RepID=UPI0030094A90
MAALVLSLQLITPSPVMISLNENGTQTTSVGEYFTYREVTIAVVAAFVCGASGVWLLFFNKATQFDPQEQSPPRAQTQPPVEIHDGGGPAPPRMNRDQQPDVDRWEETLEKLSNNQATIYERLIEAEGELAQRQLVEETDLSKATVSRTLDKLEHRHLVERERDGMGNTIYLQ